MYILYSQLTQWTCTISGGNDFMAARKTVVRRHILEQYSGFGYRCEDCKKIFGRPDQQHHGCEFASGNRCTLVNRLTRDTGAVAQRQYGRFMENIDSKIGSKLVSRASTTPSQKTATKRSQSTPNITSKKARAEEVDHQWPELPLYQLSGKSVPDPHLLCLRQQLLQVCFVWLAEPMTL